jgi:hypothetical protein
MKPKANLRLMMLFLAPAAIVLAFDRLPKMKAAASKLAALPTRLNVMSKPAPAMSSTISEAMVQPPIVIPVTNLNDSGPGILRAEWPPRRMPIR